MPNCPVMLGRVFFSGPLWWVSGGESCCCARTYLDGCGRIREAKFNGIEFWLEMGTEERLSIYVDVCGESKRPPRIYVSPRM